MIMAQMHPLFQVSDWRMLNANPTLPDTGIAPRLYYHRIVSPFEKQNLLNMSAGRSKYLLKRGLKEAAQFP